MKARAKRGKKARAIEKKPELFADLVDIWNAFVVLNNSRLPTNYYEGPKPLSFHDINSLLDLRAFEGEDKIDAFDLILHLDGGWLKWARERFTSEMSRSNKRTR